MKTSIVVGLLMMTACYGRDRPANSEAPAAKPIAAPTSPEPATPAAPAEPAADEVAGTVFETMDASEYTYALVERGGKQVWVAGPQTKLAVGTVLGPMKGTLMTGFHSDTLNRTFEQIYFVSSFPVAGGAPANPHTNPRPVATIEKVDPAPGGTTVGKVFDDKAALAGKPVVVRGKVMKVNNGILGRNWIHLQDGTGSTGTNDLMVTSSATATVGDIVVVRGKVAVDQDFGGGYKYAVLVEDATIASK